MATIAINITMERLNGHTFEKFQTALTQTRETLESKINTEITKTREILESEINQTREILETKIESTKTELHGEFKSAMSELRADLIKWMFIFWASAILTIVAGYFLK